MKDKYDIIIVGAGPVGGYLAQLLKLKGRSSLLIEEHKELGRPIHCAGLVGKKVFQEARLPLAPSCILNTINGAVIHFGKEELILRRKEVAYVINRELFDKSLGKDLNIIFETRFLGFEKNKHRYILETDKGDFSADILVGADGANSAVRSIVRKQNSIQYMRGVQFRMKFAPLYHDMVEVYIKRPYFYWIIPESAEEVRVGVISQNPYQDLLEFVKERRMGNNIIEKFAGIVPRVHFNTLSRERIFLVGDAASQVKPLSYGGIYMGMRGAEILVDCMLSGKFSQYSPRWHKHYGGEIRVALRAREIFNALTDKDIKKIFAFIKRKTSLIEEKGDFENHSLLLWEFLKHPGASREILNVFFRIIKTGLTEKL
ncbi:MAG: NAD(P)/FAD-dependent oxidoreductase [Candidatus Omnitrophota bacterium]